jgi:hypothetical protein
VSAEVGSSATEVNVLSWMSRIALELIGQGGLGYSFDPLTSNADNAYGDALKALMYAYGALVELCANDYLGQTFLLCISFAFSR